MSTTAVMNWRTPEYLAEEARLHVQSAADAAALARTAIQEIEFAKEGTDGDSALDALADEAIAASERLRATATKFAAALRKAVARRKAAA